MRDRPPGPASAAKRLASRFLPVRVVSSNPPKSGAPAELTLPEEVMLIALEDKEGRMKHYDAVDLGSVFGGAVLLELALRDRIRLEGRRVAIKEGAPLRNGVLDAAVAEIQKRNSAKTVRHWVESLGRRRMRELILDRLFSAGIVERREGRLLGILPTRRFPTQDPKPESMMLGRLRQEVAGKTPVSVRTSALLQLIAAGGLIRGAFPKGERREAARIAKKLRTQNDLGGKVTGVVQQVQEEILAVLFVGVFLPAIMANSS